MISLDTNVIVRFLVNDRPEQALIAKRLVEDNEVFVCMTVIVELDRVLRTAYGFSGKEVAAAIGIFAGLPTVEIEAPQRLARALEAASAGMDLADCLHMLARSDMEFATFDQPLAKRNETHSLVPVIALKSL